MAGLLKREGWWIFFLEIKPTMNVNFFLDRTARKKLKSGDSFKLSIQTIEKIALQTQNWGIIGAKSSVKYLQFILTITTGTRNCVVPRTNVLQLQIKRPVPEPNNGRVTSVP